MHVNQLIIQSINLLIGISAIVRPSIKVSLLDEDIKDTDIAAFQSGSSNLYCLFSLYSIWDT